MANCNNIRMEGTGIGSPANVYHCKRLAGHSGRHAYGIKRPHRKHSRDGSIRCDICAPLRCSRG